MLVQCCATPSCLTLGGTRARRSLAEAQRPPRGELADRDWLLVEFSKRSRFGSMVVHHCAMLCSSVVPHAGGYPGAEVSRRGAKTAKRRVSGSGLVAG